MGITLAQALGTRENQEDVVDVYHHADGVVAILADGMGGHDSGAEAAQAAVRGVRRAIRRRRLNNPVSVYASLTAALQVACRDVKALAENRFTTKRPGTTLIIAVVRDGFFAVMGIGDSLVWHIDDSAECRLLLEPHELQISGGALTSHVPAPDDIGFYTSTRTQGHLVLASDGLDKRPSAAVLRADRLVRSQIQPMPKRQDNVSVIVIPMPPDRETAIPKVVEVPRG